MKRVLFDEKKGHLVDEQGKKYSGERFSSVSTRSQMSTHSIESAIALALQELKTAAIEKRAEAYEITSENISDSSQEYDSNPYSASISAILYRKK